VSDPEVRNKTAELFRETFPNQKIIENNERLEIEIIQMNPLMAYGVSWD